MTDNSAHSEPDLESLLPERPHMEPEALEFLDKAMRKSQCYLEYGAGGSTRWALERQIPQIICVESDPKFAKAVLLAIDKDFDASDIEMVEVNIGKTGHWGVPSGKEQAENWPSYSLKVWERVEEKDYSPDLILIDGRFRAACCLASLLCSDPGTTILFDDYFDREKHYGIVTKFADIDKRVGRMAVFRKKELEMSSDLAFELAKNCVKYR